MATERRSCRSGFWFADFASTDLVLQQQQEDGFPYLFLRR